MDTTKPLPACPVETTLMLIGDKWKVLILRDLLPMHILKIATFRLQDYNNSIEIYCKVSTFLCCSYLIETME